jgi:single-strand DNA-binding protein
MGSLNQVTIIGNLTKDAELRYAPSGAAVANFSVATNETWKDKDTGERKERVEYHNVVLWGKAADAIAEYLVKGKQVAVVGQIHTEKWQDKETGKDRYTTKIKAANVVLLGSRGKSSSQDDGAHGYEEQTQRSETTDEDIPF